MERVTVRPIEDTDRAWVAGFMRERWGSERMVGHGELFYPGEHSGFLALRSGKPIGLVTYRISPGSCEITLIDSGPQHAGVGTALLAAVEDAARRAGCRRLWLVTTNDNLGALRFYQRRGFALASLRRNALEDARRLKPEIPETGQFGIPLRDELELEKPLL